MEKTLGIGPLPITINEYSGAADLTVEGQPGASASLIAKFERLGVESACISFWDVGHPGRLGSLLATNTDPNGGWWFYKWYGDMAGNMVSTTPPNPANSAALDGFANLDTTGRSASVLFGGTNDGSVQVVIKGLSAGSIFGAIVHVVVEHTPFVNRTTVVKATNVVSTADVAVANGQITVSVSGTNNTDGYRVTLTPIGGGTGGSGWFARRRGRRQGGRRRWWHALAAASGEARAEPAARVSSPGSGGTTASGGSAGGMAGASGKGGAARLRDDRHRRRDGTGGTSAGTGGVSGTGGDLATGSGGASPPTQTDDGSAGCSCDASDSSPSGRWLNTGTILLLLMGLPWLQERKDAETSRVDAAIVAVKMR